jgi:hypothetical protein
VSDFDPERIDLAVVARHLKAAFEQIPIEGYVVGRTRLRDAVAAHLRCSQLEAEQVVDTMIGRGFIRFEGELPDGGPGMFRIEPR